MTSLSQSTLYKMLVTRIQFKILSGIELTTEEEHSLQHVIESDSADAVSNIFKRFSLNETEQQVFILCLTAELDLEFMPLLAKISPSQITPTLALARFLHPDETGEHTCAQWLSSQSPLFKYQLIEKHQNANGHLYSPINLTSDVLAYLMDDLPMMSTMLRDLCQPIKPDRLVLASEKEMVSILTSVTDRGATHSLSHCEHTLPLLLCQGETQLPLAKHLVGLMAEQQQSKAFFIDLACLPSLNNALALLQKAIIRELTLQPILLLLHIDEIARAEASEQAVWMAWLSVLINTHPKQLVLTGTHDLVSSQFPIHTMALAPMSASEQHEVWQHELLSIFDCADQIGALTEQFNLDKWEIFCLCQRLKREHYHKNRSIDFNVLVQACQQQRQHTLGSLVTVIPPSKVNWQDLVLDAEQKNILQAVVSQVQQRHKVYHEWGFAATSCEYGLSISVLLSGSSGTGKTFAARVIASQLQREIYQINLSQVADKYIGETEKKLEQVFSSAQYNGAVLLFDEADALFGQRSKITDSKDRNANLAVSYLLQRIETYNGIAILTTNFKSALDTAFMRRIRFMVQFKFPDKAHRQRLWEQMFPDTVSTELLDFAKLARLHLAGGSIRNIVLQAAFSAAAQNTDISMMHLQQACQHEYDKTDNLLDQQLTADWT